MLNRCEIAAKTRFIAKKQETILPWAPPLPWPGIGFLHDAMCLAWYTDRNQK